jgi:competence protein ComEC
MTLLFCAWGILAAQESVWPMQHLTTGAVQAEVELTATDGATQHQGNILSVNGKRWWASTGVTLYGNYLPQKRVRAALDHDAQAQACTRRAQRRRL